MNTWFSQSRLTKIKIVALSVAKGLYNGKETLTCTATNAVRRSVSRDEHAPSERQKLDFDKIVGFNMGFVLVERYRL
jgi:hypothetical protein